MNWFKKKEKKTELELPQVVHEHTWKDMPWYMDVRFNGVHQTAGYEIIEPYICIICGERKNVKLESEDYSGIDAEARKKIFNQVRNKYKKYLKPRAVVEDMINNILLVQDANRLNMIEKIYGLPHQNVGTSSEMNQTIETNFKINLPERKKNEVD